MKRLINSALAVTIAAFFSAAIPAQADEKNNPNKGQFYVAPGAVLYSGPEGRKYGYDGDEIGAGVILGYGLSDEWSIELLASQVSSDFDNISGSGDDNIEFTWLDLVYQLKAYNGWQTFLLFGGGRTEYEFDDVRPETSDVQMNLGLGVSRAISERISLRADVRGVSSRKDGGFEPFAFVGITGFLGGTAAPVASADADGDGVPNSKDQCPTTPAGRVVDANGCQLDSDGDGVVDADDECPGTPAGVEVNRDGCPLDSDGDGVPDYKDECPDTEAGAKVDAKGCYIELEEEVTIDMNIEFETDKAEIRNDHLSELSRAVKFLREYPKTNAVIEGHTDSDGAAAYNQGLSERRAKAVYEYLVNEANIDADRLSWAGFGESQPLAENDSSANKQRNRRVTAVVTGTHMVRQ